MPVDSEELLKAAEVVAECRGMKVALKNCLGGAGLTATTTFVGGILAGPIGLAAGATVGGLAAYSMTKDKFKPVVQLLREDLTYRQKEALAFHIQQGLKDFGIEDVVQLSLFIIANQDATMVVFKTLKYFLENDMKFSVTYK